MKILQVIPTFAPAWRYGGPIHAAVGLVRTLSARGHEVTVMTTNMDGPGVLDVPVGRPVEAYGGEAWYFPIERPRGYHFSRPMARAFAEQMGRFDVVHIHSIFLWPTTAAAHWSRRRGVPYIVRPAGSLSPTCIAKPYAPWHVSAASRAKKSVYLRTVGGAELQRAQALHFTSENERRSAAPLGLRPPTHVVPLGVELGHRAEDAAALPFRERYPEIGDRAMVVYLGRLDPIKGMDVLVPAMAGLARRRDDFTLVVAGEGTPAYRQEVDALVRAHGLEGRVVFTGRVDGADKWQLLREADVFVLPSHHENFGVSVVEAMSEGVPVVITDRVDIHREVSEAGAGVVTPLDAGAFGAAVERVLDDAALRAGMGERARALVLSRFTWEAVAPELIRMYHDVAAR